MGISGLYVINAASVTFFAVMCMNLTERGMHMAMVAAASGSGFDSDRQNTSAMLGGEEFVAQNIKMVVDPTFRMWNQVQVPPDVLKTRHKLFHAKKNLKKNTSVCLSEPGSPGPL